MKIKISIITAIALFILGVVPASAQKCGNAIDLEKYKKEVISSAELAGWDFRGMGKAFDAGGGQFCLTENDSTLGVVLISPDPYAGDVIIRYKTFALTSATVLVVMHSASDLDSDFNLSIPGDYNGAMGLWTNEKDNYFYAFKNASHGYTPFIRKYPVPGGDALAIAEENHILPGKYYAIEIGRTGNKLWMNIDGEKVLETMDESILPGGHIAFRIRGTAGFKAACLIRDLEIYSEE